VVDHEPPRVTAKQVPALFPSNSRYRRFDLSDCARAFDACGGHEDIDRFGDIVAIHSDEPDDAGRRDPGHDIVILDHSSFLLRQQARDRGNGRVYEIELAVRDAHGNRSAPHSCFIGVSSRADRAPKNDGRVVTVRP